MEQKPAKKSKSKGLPLPPPEGLECPPCDYSLPARAPGPGLRAPAPGRASSGRAGHAPTKEQRIQRKRDRDKAIAKSTRERKKREVLEMQAELCALRVDRDKLVVALQQQKRQQQAHEQHEAQQRQANHLAQHQMQQQRRLQSRADAAAASGEAPPPVAEAESSGMVLPDANNCPQVAALPVGVTGLHGAVYDGQAYDDADQINFEAEAAAAAALAAGALAASGDEDGGKGEGEEKEEDSEDDEGDYLGPDAKYQKVEKSESHEMEELNIDPELMRKVRGSSADAVAPLMSHLCCCALSGSKPYVVSTASRA